MRLIVTALIAVMTLFATVPAGARTGNEKAISSGQLSAAAQQMIKTTSPDARSH